MPSDGRPWQSYDDVASAYDGAVPDSYASLAEDLVAAAGLAVGARVLDVGCGTGAVARAARRAVGPGGLVVGADPSTAMLRPARGSGVACLVGTGCPDLALRDGVFDAALANLVLSHFLDYTAALRDVVRVVRAGGRVGVTAWGSGASERHRLWTEEVVACIGRTALDEAIRASVPWEGRFGDPQQVRAALRGAGLVAIEVERHEYPGATTVREFVATMEISSVGRFLRHALPPAGWRAFRTRILERLRARFGDDPLPFVAGAYVALGRRR